MSETYITNRYWLPRYKDAGINSTIETLANQQYDITAFMEQLNAQISPDMNKSMFYQYLADVQADGQLLEIDVSGTGLPSFISRYPAPTGLGQDATAVFFSTPDTGTLTVSWFVNGTLVKESSQDVATNRSATKAELGTSVGDIVQVAILYQDIAGWWARIEVT